MTNFKSLYIYTHTHTQYILYKMYLMTKLIKINKNILRKDINYKNINKNQFILISLNVEKLFLLPI